MSLLELEHAGKVCSDVRGHALSLASLAGAAKRVLCVTLALSLACGMTGCKLSDRLTEVIYDQDSEIIDYDNPTKVQVQDPTAEETTSDLPLVEGADSIEDEQRQDPVESDEPDDEDEREADDDHVNEEQATDVSVSTNDEGSDLVPVGGSSSGELSDANLGNEGEGDDDGEGGEVQNPNGGSEGASDGDVIGGTSGARGGGEQTYYSSVGAYQSVPVGIDYVAAFGEAATIVSMLAGETGALRYTDSAWKSRPNIQKVLGAKYNANASAVCSDDDSYGISDAWVQTMINDELLECVFVISGKKTFTTAQEQALQRAGVVVSYLPALTSASGITEAVSWVGRVFGAGTSNNQKALELAKQYVSFHDSVLQTAANVANTDPSASGGSKPVVSKGTQYYTLYVSDWADDVYYLDPSFNISMPSGIGICRVGYIWSPMCYYMSVAGVYNTGARASSDTTDTTSLVWQFNGNHLSAFESSFSRTGLVGHYQRGTSNTAYGWTYLAAEGDGSKGFGTSVFPLLITRTQKQKANIEADRALGESSNSINTLYELYPIVNYNFGSVIRTWVGPFNPTTVVYAVGGCLEKQSADQTEQDVQGMNQRSGYAVVTNPEGLFGESWTDGSVESVLEAAWISYLYHPDSYENSFVSQTIVNFYSAFYGCNLQSEELSVILAGPEG